MEVTVPGYRISSQISLDPRLTSLIVVDMQVDFVSPKGKLCVPEARKTIPQILNLISKARKAKCTIFFTQDWHRADDPEFSIWPVHAVAGTVGAKVTPQLKPAPRDYFIHKKTYDAFFGTDLDLILRQMRIQNVIVTGTVANICVLHTAGSARLRGYEVIVPVDAVSALTPFDLQAAFRQISFLYKGKLVESKGVKFQKVKRAANPIF